MRTLFEAEDPEFHGSRIDYSGVLFSPKPSPRLPIMVGGTSRRALKRAATLGDGWHGIYRTPEEVVAAIAVMAQYGRKNDFRISLRTRVRIGDTVRGAKTGPGLTGSAADLAEQVERYAAAGVDELVIEPDAAELDDFTGQMTRFSAEVAARYAQA
jgi:alkanesulfonate monooxygenase SsuD/methylene tetrahydromethanopterin reductase-like flavin-dependent oxidoreductase (luciferase family)